MIDCSNNKNLSHKKWVQYQFDCGDLKKGSTYRDVFVHTSLIEGIVINESVRQHELTKKERKRGYRGMSQAIEYLGWENTPVDKLNTERNKLIHHIALVSMPLDQNQIEEKRDNMYAYILEIYKSQNPVRELFQQNYEFDPKDKI